ncbi:MAG: LysR family transcriptional regulator [Hyphomicrobiales bacterium]|nr:LysR family transcriptional regulator [Hyphomicrobiales bacterium]
MVRMNVADVDLRLIKVFLTVARSGGFTPAQALLNISQSTISNHIKSLESRLGVRLCDRGRAGFRLTAEGLKIVDASERLLHSIEEFRSETLALKGRLAGDILIGIVDNTVSDPRSPIIRTLADLTGRSPEIRPFLTVGDPQTLELDVTNGRLHAAIGVFPAQIPSLSRIPFYVEDQGFYCADTHALFLKSAIIMDDIRRSRVISRSYWRLADLQRLGMRDFGAIANSMEAALGLILTGRFVGFLPVHIAEPHVVEGRMRRILADTLSYRAEIVVIFKAGGSMTPLLAALIGCCEQNAESKGCRRHASPQTP